MEFEMLLIDGYNLIFLGSKKMGKTDFTELKKSRDDLIYKLNKYAQKKNAKVIVVFDSSNEDPFAQASRKIEEQIEVIFTSKGISADSVINDIVQKSTSPSSYTVVSSDLSIAQVCSKSGAKMIPSEKFLEKLFSVIGVKKEVDNDIKFIKEKTDGISKEDAKFWLDIFQLPENINTDEM